MSLTGQKVRQKRPPPERSEAHKEFVRSKGCMLAGQVSGCDWLIDAHHTRMGAGVTEFDGKKMGPRGCDSLCVPLCRAHHSLLHKIGNEKKFWAGMGWTPRQVTNYAAELWTESTGKPVPWRVS